MLAQGADTLVLGCTHYPFLRDAIFELYGDRLQMIDTSVAVVRQLCRLIKAPESSQKGYVEVYSTHDGRALLELAQKLLTHPYIQDATAHTVAI
jgi:glutamate racemase